jgi:phosphate transport system permease protein
MAPFIAGSVAVTVVALLTAAPPAVLSGVYLAEYLRPRQRSFIRPLLELLVGLPSVVFGLWGIVVIVPLVREIVMPWSHQTLGQIHPFFAGGNTTGYGLLTAGLVLGISVYPLIAAVTQEVLLTIPQAARETALCLGATRWEATKIIVFHHGLPGIGAAVVLAFARAFGETLAVLMLAGNVVQMPNNLFDGVYTLPALIANNYGEMMSVPLYQSALMLAALVLLLVVLIFNLLARLVILRLQRRAQ